MERADRYQAGRARAARATLLALLATLLLAAGAVPAVASESPPQAQPVGSQQAQSISPQQARTLEDLLSALPERYEAAQHSHDTQLAAPVRATAEALAREARARLVAPAAGSQSAVLVHRLEQIAGALAATRERFRPWPLGFELRDLVARAQAQAARTLHAAPAPSDRFGALQDSIEELISNPPTRARGALEALRPYALYVTGPGRRLPSSDPQLDANITDELALGGGSSKASVAELLAAGHGGGHLAAALGRVRTEVGLAGQVLGLVHVSRTTVALDGAIIVFREGLEAVLILAAITASFTGARRHLRRPVLLGALAGVLATVLTWVVAQLLLHLLGDGGLRLQAITGLVAIGVLLLVTNWFFHRVYWSEWIARFNRRRRSLERLDKLGFISGQTLGFLVLGLSSVYREGLETVLFLQALQTSAGTATAALGAGAGLLATLLVGWLTFRLQRKLPFRRMLVLTGVLIALVLAVMVGTTVHNMQGIGWISTTPTSFTVSLDLSRWLGIYGTWEGILAQAGSLLFVIGSYFAARELKVNGPHRRARRADRRRALAERARAGVPSALSSGGRER